MGLVVGGKTSEQIEHLVKLLKQSQDENTHLKGMVQNLAVRSGLLEERMEQRWNQFISSQQNYTHQQQVNGEEHNHHQQAEQQQFNYGFSQKDEHLAQI